MAKKVINELVEKGGDPERIVKERGWAQISDEATLLPIVIEVLDENEQSVIDFKNGKNRALGHLVGQVMKKTRGMANPPLVNKLIIQEIEKR